MSVRMVNDPPQQDLVVVSSWFAHGKTIQNQSLAAITLTMFSLSFPHNLAAIMRRYLFLLWFWLGNRKVRGKNIATIRYRLATTGSDSTPLHSYSVEVESSWGHERMQGASRATLSSSIVIVGFRPRLDVCGIDKFWRA